MVGVNLRVWHYDTKLFSRGLTNPDFRDISWLPLFFAVHFSNRRFRAENLFNRPHHFVLCSDFPRASQSLSN
jgi:hypothetical protein